MDYSKITLGELLSSENETIKRNAISILKVLQKPIVCKNCRYIQAVNLNKYSYCEDCWREIKKDKEKFEMIISKENKCPICNDWVDIYGRCGCCNKDAF